MNDFPFKYVGGGYFRDSRVPKKQTATVLHGDEAIRAAILFTRQAHGLELAQEVERLRQELIKCKMATSLPTMV